MLTLTGLFIALYLPAYYLMVSWWGREDYTYCWFVPLIVAYLLWEKRCELARVPALPSWGGLAALLPGMAIYWLGELGGEYFTLYLSSWLVLVGVLWLQLGWRKLKVIAFPVAFLLTMFPLPNVVFNNMTLQLKLLSSQIGVALIRLAGLTAFREGNIIDLGFTQLQVVDACSGLRYLIPLLVLGVLVAHYHQGRRWERALLVLSTIPLTIVTNSLRIASVGVLYPLLGARVAEGFFHDFSGWLIFMVSLALLLGEIWLLRKIAGSREPAVGERGGDAGLPVTGHRLRPTWLLTGVAVLLLGATLAVTRTVDFREKVPIVKPLLQFPLQVGEWQGGRSALDAQVFASLHLSDYLLADYRSPTGETVSLYVAYNESQRKGESSHSPASCLPGSGWVFEESGLVTIRGAAGPMQVRRAFMQKSGERMLVYYWFPQRGRILTSMVQLKLYAFYDALTRRRTDGALVRLITPVRGTETQEAAAQRLGGFASQVVPDLRRFIPE